MRAQHAQHLPVLPAALPRLLLRHSGLAAAMRLAFLFALSAAMAIAPRRARRDEGAALARLAERYHDVPVRFDPMQASRDSAGSGPRPDGAAW